MRLLIESDPDYGDEIEHYLIDMATDSDGPAALPVEYYRVDWRTFSGKILTARPKELTTAIIDSRTIRAGGGMDYHLKQILNDHLDPTDKAAVSLAVRATRDELAAPHLQTVNDKMAGVTGPLDDQPLTLGMDQTGRGAWDSNVIPHVDDVPFQLSGQGQQAAIKIALAMGGTAATAQTVMIEEPENHMSHTNLNKLLARINHLWPEQWSGEVDVHSFYFRERDGDWSIEVDLRPSGRFAWGTSDDYSAACSERRELDVGDVIAYGTTDVEGYGTTPRERAQFITDTIRIHLSRQACTLHHNDLSAIRAMIGTAVRWCPACGTRLPSP
ncbi:hypothetical protein [Mycobacterium sp. M23085]|uniref:hypothetical protein n=1 Tax=Mycobacterium sp. M23085 TaxID=3378087 RepID=UPI003877E07D